MIFETCPPAVNEARARSFRDFDRTIAVVREAAGADTDALCALLRESGWYVWETTPENFAKLGSHNIGTCAVFADAASLSQDYGEAVERYLVTSKNSKIRGKTKRDTHRIGFCFSSS